MFAQVRRPVTSWEAFERIRRLCQGRASLSAPAFWAQVLSGILQVLCEDFIGQLQVNLPVFLSRDGLQAQSLSTAPLSSRLLILNISFLSLF